jgi:hypothetical protein
MKKYAFLMLVCCAFGCAPKYFDVTQMPNITTYDIKGVYGTNEKKGKKYYLNENNTYEVRIALNNHFIMERGQYRCKGSEVIFYPDSTIAFGYEAFNFPENVKRVYIVPFDDTFRIEKISNKVRWQKIDKMRLSN